MLQMVSCWKIHLHTCAMALKLMSGPGSTKWAISNFGPLVRVLSIFDIPFLLRTGDSTRGFLCSFFGLPILWSVCYPQVGKWRMHISTLAPVHNDRVILGYWNYDCNKEVLTFLHLLPSWFFMWMSSKSYFIAVKNPCHPSPCHFGNCTHDDKVILRCDESRSNALITFVYLHVCNFSL